MGLLTENNLQYYGGTQLFTQNANTRNFISTFDTELIFTTNNPTNTSYSLNNCELYQSADLGVTWTPYNTLANANYTATFNSLNNTISTGTPIASGTWFMIQLKQAAIENNYGSYEYVSINDIVNNYMVGYVGDGKIIQTAKKSDVLFFAKRSLQEFSYDTLKSIKSQELTIPENLSLVMPQDYVNYVSLCYIDSMGVKRPLYPNNNLTTNPYTKLLQDDTGLPTQDSFGENLEGTSITVERWQEANQALINSSWYQNWVDNGYMFEDYGVGSGPWNWGALYGINPQYANSNGWFGINEREGKFTFSSNLVNKLIVIEYISDGLAYDLDTRVPKMAEEAMYLSISYNLLANRANIADNIVQRFKKDRRAALRNAKIRLSNIKLEEFTQVMRGKSKWLKH